MIGGVALVGAIVLAFAAFQPYTAFLVAIGIIVLLGICLVLWIKFFPKTRIGRSLTLAKDVKTYKATDEDLYDLLNSEGVAQTSLRPGGIAKIGGRRKMISAIRRAEAGLKTTPFLKCPVFKYSPFISGCGPIRGIALGRAGRRPAQ